jgi:hypothetical protein
MRKLLIAGAALTLISGAAMAQANIAPSTAAGNPSANNTGGPASGSSSTQMPANGQKQPNGSATVETGKLDQGHTKGSDSSSK